MMAAAPRVGRVPIRSLGVITVHALRPVSPTVRTSIAVTMVAVARVAPVTTLSLLAWRDIVCARPIVRIRPVVMMAVAISAVIARLDPCVTMTSASRVRVMERSVVQTRAVRPAGSAVVIRRFASRGCAVSSAFQIARFAPAARTGAAAPAAIASRRAMSVSRAYACVRPTAMERAVGQTAAVGSVVCATSAIA